MVGVFFGIGSVEAGFGGEFGEIGAVGGVAGRVGCRGGGAGGGVGGALGRGLIVGVTAGIAITSGLSAWLSWVLAAETRNGERQPGTVGQGMDLRAGVAAVDRAGTGQRSPFRPARRPRPRSRGSSR